MDARRTLIADAALTVIGRDGTRALTHHAVDDQAGLSRGSTSYYCRKRVDLLRLALQRLYALDEADLRAMAESVPSGSDREAVWTASAELIHAWLEGDGRARSTARIELFMAASHEPDLHPLLSEQLAGMRAAALPLVADDAVGAQRVAAGFLLTEGLVLAVLREGLPAPSVSEIRALLALLG